VNSRIRDIACALLVATLAGAGPAEQRRCDGVISGTVVNGTRRDQPVAGAEVVLRVGVDGRFVSVESVRSGPDGRFEFTRLPVGTGHVYLPGANWQDVHFPGERIILDADRSRATTEVTVYDSKDQPSPLMIESMEIVVRTLPGALEVTETMQIRNPSRFCYVGAPRHSEGGPVTLELRIPPDFKRITFEREGFGRRFAVIREKLVTSIPWPPGERSLRYTYVVPHDKSTPTWLRPLDLPCRQLRLRVETDAPRAVACSLDSTGVVGDASVEFVVNDELSVGHPLKLEFGHVSVPWMSYAKWGAVILLAIAVAVAVIGARRQWHPRLPVSQNRRARADLITTLRPPSR